MYNYYELRPEVFKPENQKEFLEIRDKVNEIIRIAGCINMGHAMAGAGESWVRMAMVDRLVELGEIREVKQVGNVAGQHRIFTK
jgi:hypothetical protein